MAASAATQSTLSIHGSASAGRPERLTDVTATPFAASVLQTALPMNPLPPTTVHFSAVVVVAGVFLALAALALADQRIDGRVPLLPPRESASHRLSNSDLCLSCTAVGCKPLTGSCMHFLGVCSQVLKVIVL